MPGVIYSTIDDVLEDKNVLVVVEDATHVHLSCPALGALSLKTLHDPMLREMFACRLTAIVRS